jgi:hypothetical protein
MSQEQQKNNRALIIVAVIGVIGTVTASIDVIGNKILSSFQRYLSVVDTEIMQATSQDHHQIRKTVFSIPQNILHGSRTLDARNGMFDFDADFGQLAIFLFLFVGQFLFTRLFFG